jgi:hypothetical protein
LGLRRKGRLSPTTIGINDLCRLRRRKEIFQDRHFADFASQNRQNGDPEKNIIWQLVPQNQRLGTFYTTPGFSGLHNRILVRQRI